MGGQRSLPECQVTFGKGEGFTARRLESGHDMEQSPEVGNLDAPPTGHEATAPRSHPAPCAPPPGDEVDPGLIIPGGRRARRGRPSGSGGAAGPRYQAAPALDSDEDEW